MKICEKCNTENKDTSIFCKQCGSALNRSVDEQTPKASGLDTLETGSQVTPISISSDSDPHVSKSHRSRKQIWLLAFGGIVAICLIGTVIALGSPGQSAGRANMKSQTEAYYEFDNADADLKSVIYSDEKLADNNDSLDSKALSTIREEEYVSASKEKTFSEERSMSEEKKKESEQVEEKQSGQRNQSDIYTLTVIMKIREKPNLDARQIGRGEINQKVTIVETKDVHENGEDFLWGRIEGVGWICIQRGSDVYLVK